MSKSPTQKIVPHLGTWTTGPRNACVAHWRAEEA